MRRRRWKSPDLVLQELEKRTLLSVTAFLNPASSTDLEVDLSAVGDQALITPSGSTIVVSGADGTTYSGPPSFLGVTEIAVYNTSGQTDAAQSVTFQPAAGQSSGTFDLSAASGTNALLVNGISSVTFTGVTIDATSGDVDVQASATTAPTSGLVASSAPSASIDVENNTAITADNITLNASASSTYTYSAPLGGAANDLGAAASIADIEPSANCYGRGVFDQGQRDRRERHDRFQRHRHGQRHRDGRRRRRRQPGGRGDRHIDRQLLGGHRGQRLDSPGGQRQCEHQVNQHDQRDDGG